MEKKEKQTKWIMFRERLYRMVSVGVEDDAINHAYDVISTVALVLNLFATFALTFDDAVESMGGALKGIEAVTVFFFAVDYVLRLITAKCMHPRNSEAVAVRRYVLSFYGIIDLLSFLPYYMPFFFPRGAAVFRLFRVARIFKLFRINAYYDSLNVISEVIVRKKQQLLSSVYILLVMIVATSLCMYGLEHDAQPEVFSNAFSGIWWATSCLFTVGYGDIYPVTPLGQVFGIVITFLGVGVVAIPTGIISAGFVEQYTRLKRIGDHNREEDIHFIELVMGPKDPWVGKEIKELGLPKGAIIAVILRGRETLIPRGDTMIHRSDVVVLGAESVRNGQHIHLKEVTLGKGHPWVGVALRDLDISQLTLIVMIKRHGRTRIPHGDMVLLTGDVLYIYSKSQKASQTVEEREQGTEEEIMYEEDFSEEVSQAREDTLAEEIPADKK